MAALGKLVVGAVLVIVIVTVCKGLGGEWLLDQIPTK